MQSGDAANSQEEEDVQLNDEEEAISAYLKDEDALPNDILDKVLLPFWNKEPFKLAFRKTAIRIIIVDCII